MYKSYWIALVLLMFTAQGYLCAQHLVEGIVMAENAKGQLNPLEFVHVQDLAASTGAYTDSTGYFRLELPEPENEDWHSETIVVTYVGFQPDTIRITDKHYVSIVLRDNTVLDEVQVVYRKDSTQGTD